jgi:AcrR family transcriptional regulator
MARKPPLSPRKSASQERSRRTVDSLVEATARILVKEGYEKASTNRIASVAGVSIGSLYQYFPGKDSLVAAVVDRHTSELSQVVRGALVKAAARPIKLAARDLVATGVEAHRVDPDLHRVLSEQIPKASRPRNVLAVEEGAYMLVHIYLEAHQDELDIDDLDIATFICLTTVEALAHAAVLHHPEMLTGETGKRFVDDVTRLLVRYLCRDKG